MLSTSFIKCLPIFLLSLKHFCYLHIKPEHVNGKYLSMKALDNRVIQIYYRLLDDFYF